MKARRDDGITLVMALILLVLLTLLTLTSVNLGNGNLQAVGNMQQREQVVAAANQVLEETLSNTKFFMTPNTAIAAPCNGVANERCVDLDGDGKEDVHVKLTPPPTCAKAAVIKNVELDLSNADDRGCSTGVTQNFGVVGAADGGSDCAKTVWDLNAVATDVATGATVKITQGVAVQVAKDDVATNCP